MPTHDEGMRKIMIADARESILAVSCGVCGKTPPFSGGTRCQRTDCGLIEWACKVLLDDSSGCDVDSDSFRMARELVRPTPSLAAPVAYIEHHKGGDNLVWERSSLPCDPLYAAPPSHVAATGETKETDARESMNQRTDKPAAKPQSDTPRTDAVFPKTAYAGDNSECPINHPDAQSIYIEDWRELDTLARQLERELAEAHRCAEEDGVRFEAALAVARRDAERYRWLRDHTGANRDSYGCYMSFPVIHRKGSKFMQGSVAQHLDEELDAAIALNDKEQT
ncbi:MAG: hypothetical protein Q7J84_17485 [Sulfuricaulis sp.]|nr:hypothetical protein [Sulfuricaulis sp.]